METQNFKEKISIFLSQLISFSKELKLKIESHSFFQKIVFILKEIYRKINIYVDILKETKVFKHISGIFSSIFQKIKQKPRSFYIKWAFFGVSGFILMIFCFVLAVYLGVFGRLPNENDIKGLKQAQASLIYDRNNELIGKFFVYDRTNIAFEDFPKHLIDALIATEDERFYEHKGVDTQSLMRVLFKTILLQKESSGGGSTISMQLAKNIYGRQNYGKISMLVHKVKEIFIAKRIEKIYSKQEILTLYLNTVPFSDNTFGIESASQRFFKKSARNLTLNEAATLVGSLKATGQYNPRTSPEKSILRRNVVLAQMKRNDFLSDSLFNEKASDTLLVSYQHFSDNQSVAPYLREQIRLKIPSILKNIKKEDGSEYNIYKDGLKIYTSVDKKLQEMAEKSAKTHIDILQKDFELSYGKNPPWSVHNEWFKAEIKKTSIYKNWQKKDLSDDEIFKMLSKESAVKISEKSKNDTIFYSKLDSISDYFKRLNLGFLALNPKTGEVLSYVGGVDFQYYKYDHIIQSRRQVGSTFKPIVYAAAVDFGIPICTHFSPHPISYPEYEDWTPTNASQVKVGENTEVSLSKAIRESINTVAVQTLFYVGIDNVVKKAKEMGITSEIPKVPAIALGALELPMIELAKAYTTFSNKGVPVSPYFIEKITDKNGKVLYEHQKKEEKPAFSEQTCQIMLEFLRGTINKGTAARMRSRFGITNDIAGKTGTTQNNKDGWFVSFTPELLMLSWVGNDNQIGFKTTGLGQGANSALPITALFLQKVNANKKLRKLAQGNFSISEEIFEEIQNCPDTIAPNFIERIFSDEVNSVEDIENQRLKDQKIKEREEFREKLNKRKSFFERIFR